MAFDALKVLEGAGTPVGELPQHLRDVFKNLSPEEVTVLTSLQSKIDAAAAEPEVVGQSDNINIVC